MINLFDEFFNDEKEGLNLLSWDTKKGCYSKDVFNELLQEKLEEGKLNHELINLKGIRNIGKTSTLVEFAKKYNYTIVVGIEEQAIHIKEHFDYKKVIDQFVLKDMKDRKTVKLVLDETANYERIKEFKNQIVTGYVKDNDEYISKSISKNNIDNEDILSILDVEIRQLASKIAQARESNNFGTYKNLIQAFANILELKNKYEKVE